MSKHCCTILPHAGRRWQILLKELFEVPIHSLGGVGALRSCKANLEVVQTLFDLIAIGNGVLVRSEVRRRSVNSTAIAMLICKIRGLLRDRLREVVVGGCGVDN